jgi:cell division transport system permease protein
VLTYGLQVTISLLVLGYFLVVIVGISNFIGRLSKMVEIHAYLSKDLAPEDFLRIDKEIKALEGVEKVKFISAEEAAENWNKTTGTDLESLLEYNPLPASYTVKAKRLDKVKELAEQVRRINGIDDVRYGQDIVVKLSRALFVAQLIFGVTILLLLGASFSSINNIVRLSIYSRRREIRIMQLVGATKWFIRWPFLLEGMLVGMLGGAVSAGLVWASYYGLANLIGELKVLSAGAQMEPARLEFIVLALVALGSAVGLASSFSALNRFLYEDEKMLIETARIRRELEDRK